MDASARSQIRMAASSTGLSALFRLLPRNRRADGRGQWKFRLDGAVVTFGEGFHDAVPDASRSPTNPVVAGRVRPKALRRSRHGAPDRNIQKMPLRTRRSLPSAHRAACSEERPDGSPLKVREFVSHDSRLRFETLNHAYRCVRNVEFRSEMGRIADMLQI